MRISVFNIPNQRPPTFYAGMARACISSAPDIRQQGITTLHCRRATALPAAPPIPERPAFSAQSR